MRDKFLEIRSVSIYKPFQNTIRMIALRVLATFCLATFCLVSAGPLTENDSKLELLKARI